MDTTKIADNIDGLADREFKTGGMKVSFGSIMAILAFLSTIVGALYAGFLMWQKIEAVTGLDLDEYQLQKIGLFLEITIKLLNNVQQIVIQSSPLLDGGQRQLLLLPMIHTAVLSLLGSVKIL